MSPRSEAFGSTGDLAKTGGHNLLVFVKALVPPSDNGGTHLKVSQALRRIGMSNASANSIMYAPPPDASGPRPAAVDRRMQLPVKVLLAAAYACKRVDLFMPTPDDDGLDDVEQSTSEWAFRKVAMDANDNATKHDFWQNRDGVARLHKHVYHLCVAAAKAADIKANTTLANELTCDLPALHPLGEAGEAGAPVADNLP